MTTYEALSLLVQFSISMTAGLTLFVTIVVLLNKKK
ncbi:putative holin-like toxin [Ornithinibacillus salinisoli]|uniref:Holin-like toxin n=1 Tax=Ornithinibacillus salinisoli TaxID=1848459 RepID=A0ABW4VXS7_9BACI